MTAVATGQEVLERGRRKLWRIPPPVDPAFADQIPGTSRMLTHLLYQRGYRSAEEIRTFLEQPVPDYDPFRMPDMDRAVVRLRQAVESHERIAIYGDFDCDGLTASAAIVGIVATVGYRPRGCDSNAQRRTRHANRAAGSAGRRWGPAGN